MSKIPFDVDLMAKTSEKISASLFRDFDAITDSHGIDFAASVIGNTAVELIVTLLASESSPQGKAMIMAGILSSIRINLRQQLTQMEAEEVIAKAMGKGRAS